MSHPATRIRHKREIYALVSDLHAAGVKTAAVIAKVLDVSDRYVRRILIDLRLVERGPETPEQALGAVDTQLRLRIRQFRNGTNTEAQR